MQLCELPVNQILLVNLRDSNLYTSHRKMGDSVSASFGGERKVTTYRFIACLGTLDPSLIQLESQFC